MKKLSENKKKLLKKEMTSSFVGFLGWFIKLIVFLVSFAAIFSLGFYLYFNRDLPKISSLADYRPLAITTVFSDDNTKIAEFFDERRTVIPFENMPKMLINAFVATEDARFFNHEGIDIFSIIRAFFKNIEAGAIVQGGSTITQQVARSFFLTPERNYSRKIREAILAYRIDRKFTKEQILYLYLNQIYLGHGAYGVETAANTYFGKTAKELNLAECAILAGLPKAPNRYSPLAYPERANKRQLYVLKRMVEEKYITEEEAENALNTKLDIVDDKNPYEEVAPYYAEYARRYIEKKYGRDALYRDGLKVYTSVNIDMQKIAEEEVKAGLHDIDRRDGYRGASENISLDRIDEFFDNENFPEKIEKNSIIKGVVTKICEDDKKAEVTIGSDGLKGIINIENAAWARKPNNEIAYYEAESLKAFSDILSVGDVILVKAKKWIEKENIWELSLEQIPKVQGALLCMEAETGFVKAMIGGFDFATSKFNRAIQSKRQPGSAFKHIIYAAAIDKGYTPATKLIDTPIVFQDEENNFTWKPKNYSEEFSGSAMFRDAFAKSRNVVTIKILRDIGVSYVINYAKKLGIESELTPDLSLALGSSSVSLLELVSSYSVFANNGYLVRPIFITKIEDRDGKVLEESVFEKKQVIEESTAYIMTSLLQSVVTEGTGWRVRALKRPAAGKTGTTDNQHDAWFMGYTPTYVTGVWVGFDQEDSLGKGETGSRAASPIWLGFMKRILDAKPIRAFQVPKGVVFTKIDADTGLLPNSESKNVIMECFKEGTVPKEYSSKNNLIDVENIFKLDVE